MMYGDVTDSPFTGTYPFPPVQAFFFISFSDSAVEHIPATVPNGGRAAAAPSPFSSERSAADVYGMETGAGHN